MIDEACRGGGGKVVAKEVADGKAVVLPPLQPVDSMFVENAMSKSIEYHYHMGQHIYVDGPSGAGKTYPIEQVLRKLGKRYVKLNFADGIRLSDLTAKQEIVVQDGTTQTTDVDGILPFGMRHGGAWVGEEGGQQPPESGAIVTHTQAKTPAEQ